MEKMSESMISLHNLVEATRPTSLVFGSPQLAALHSMAEKTPSLTYPHPAFVPVTIPNGTIKPIAIPASFAVATSANSTPHGIKDILSRPDGQAAAAATAALANHGLLNRFAGYAAAGPAAAAAGLYFHRMGKPLTGGEFGSAAGQAAAAAAAAFYWPANLLHSPMWRDAHISCPPVSSASPSSQCTSDSTTDKDGKKKHTRPTFSGQQIFALEKTFEQTKYLAGPERARLAYALGMSESQVKVWFQNRRTKWRKKHAAEMAAAKRKHDSTHHVSSSAATAADHYSTLHAHHPLLAAGPGSCASTGATTGPSAAISTLDQRTRDRVSFDDAESRSERSLDDDLHDDCDDDDDGANGDENDEEVDVGDVDAENEYDYDSVVASKRRRLDSCSNHSETKSN